MVTILQLVVFKKSMYCVPISKIHNHILEIKSLNYKKRSKGNGNCYECRGSLELHVFF